MRATSPAERKGADKKLPGLLDSSQSWFARNVYRYQFLANSPSLPDKTSLLDPENCYKVLEARGSERRSWIILLGWSEHWLEGR